MATKKKRRGGKPRIRSADAKLDGLARKMLGHFIPYEVGMLRALHKRLQAGSASQLERNATIESFHIHARNLMEFFKDDKQCAIDPRTFTNEAYRIQGYFMPASLERKISQQIVHLTHERTDVVADKLSDEERDRTFDGIEEQIQRFEKYLMPMWRPIWQEGLKVMKFDEPIGPSSEVFRYASGPTGAAGPASIEIPRDQVLGASNYVQMTPSMPQATTDLRGPKDTTDK